MKGQAMIKRQSSYSQDSGVSTNPDTVLYNNVSPRTGAKSTLRVRGHRVTHGVQAYIRSDQDACSNDDVGNWSIQNGTVEVDEGRGVDTNAQAILHDDRLLYIWNRKFTQRGRGHERERVGSFQAGRFLGCEFISLRDVKTRRGWRIGLAILGARWVHDAR